MASQPELLQSCLQTAALAAQSALERSIDAAVSALQVEETQCEKIKDRDAMATAWRDLLKHKSSWAVQYTADLKLRVADESDAVAATQVPGSLRPERGSEAGYTPSALARLGPTSRAITLDSFSLVDDDALSQSIESARLLQRVLPAVEQPLAELNTLMGTVQGLANVQPELNPLRPDVFVSTLQQIVQQTPAEPTVRTLWLQHLAEPLGREIKRVYERVINQLELAQVQGANYRVLQTPASAMRGGGGAGGGGKGGGTGQGPAGQGGAGMSAHAPLQDWPAEPPQYADLSNYEIQDALFQDFLFHGGSRAQQGLAPAYYAAVDEELAALASAPDSGAAPLDSGHFLAPADYQNAAPVDRPVRYVDEASQLNPQTWGAYGRSKERTLVRSQLKKQATQVGQVLGLEVVRKLVNQVAKDPRLLVPVREAIVALEPSLLRLAMVDPRFFSDEGHAGRRIMERVAQRSFKYNDEFSPEFLGFFGPVASAYKELNDLAIDSVQPFAMALATLEYSWDEQDQQEAQHRNRVLQALRFAEERQTLADEIGFHLSTRTDLEQVPGMVLDFLFGPWALAIAHAQLVDTQNQVDPMGLRALVPDLVWSVKTRVTLHHPAKLIAMIPPLLTQLHSGLALLGQDPRENEAFFEGLMKLHHPVLKLRRVKSQRDAQESGAMPLEPQELPATPEQRRAKAAEQPWLGRDDLDAAGFEDTQPSENAALDAIGEWPEGWAQDQQGAPDEAHSAHIDTRPGEPTMQGDEAIDARARPDASVIASTAPAGRSQSAATRASEAPPPPPPLTQGEAEQILQGLRTSQWVDLSSKRRWLRAQLVWASTKGTLFMFISHGGQPHSMTKRSCERLIRERLLRPVDQQGVVAQALDAVAQQAQPAAPFDEAYPDSGAYAPASMAGLLEP